MEKWLLAVGTYCADEAREAEFNEWYEKTHLPDILETPGFVRAIRYENTEPADGKAAYVVTYETETDDIDKCIRAHRDNMDRKRAAGRFSDLVVVVGQSLYRQQSILSK